MLPLYAARIEDLGLGDFVKVDCPACHHVALLTPEALLKVGLSRAAKVLDLKRKVPVPRMRSEGASRRVDQVTGTRQVSGTADTGPSLPPTRFIPLRSSL